MIQHAIPAYAVNADKITTLTDTLWTILTDASRDSAAGSTIFVLDALDECAEEDFEMLVRLLKTLFLREPTNIGKVKFLLTCRPYDNIVSEFDDLVDSFPSIRIPGEDESDAISQEVNSVIRHRVQKLNFSPAVKDHLQQRLMQIQHRTYLWVYLVFDYLKTPMFTKKTKKGVESAIATLPESVNQAYEKILGKHTDSQIVSKARKALSIILVAARPLTLAEMNIAVNTNISLGSMEDLDLESEDDFATSLRSWCGLFVSVYHGKVYFLHQTAREFLLPGSTLPAIVPPSTTWQHSISIPQAHAILTEVCVVYLSLLDDEPIPAAGYAFDSCYEDYPFLRYSAGNWVDHFREGDVNDDSDIIPFALGLCNPGSNYYPWERIGSAAVNFEPHDITRLAVVLANGADVTATDGYQGTALAWAANFGDEAVVVQLLGNGADINAMDGCGRTALFHASSPERPEIARLLIKEGAYVDRMDRYGRTALFQAALQGRIEIARLLIEKGAYPNETDLYGWTPLICAALRGRLEIARLLIDYAAEVNTRDYYGWTALLYATLQGHLEIAKLLIEKGADVNATDNNGWAALLHATLKGRPEMARLLIEKGADINAKDYHGWTALHYAIRIVKPDEARLLLEKGADINAVPQHMVDLQAHNSGKV